MAVASTPPRCCKHGDERNVVAPFGSHEQIGEALPLRALLILLRKTEKELPDIAELSKNSTVGERDRVGETT